MKKPIRTNQMLHPILISVLIALVSFGIGISCSKDAGISSISPTDDSVSSRRLVGTKPAVGGSNYADFHPQTGVDYDPFKGMNEEERKNAIGGREAAEKYLRVIVAHLARAMHNEQARHILHKVVPKVDDGEIHLAQIAAEYPDLLGVLSNGFKDAVDAKDPGGALHLKTQNTESNGEAILKVSKALCDLILTVVTSDGQTWNPARAIPVFFSPLTDEKVTTVMEGVDTDLKAITAPFGRDKEGRPSVFLLVKADENSPIIDSNKNAIKVSMAPSSSGMWSSIFKSLNSISLVSPAYAHDQQFNHGPHYFLIKPAKEIQIFVPHEDETNLDIKIDVRIQVTRTGYVHKETFDLRDVDKINIPYTKYANLKTKHGAAQYWNDNYIYWIRIYETDWWNDDDEVCRWSNIPMRNPGERYLARWQGDVGIGEDGQGLHQDAELTIEKLNE